MELIYKEESYNIIGAAMEVHSVLGCGFYEAVYHEALSIEFMQRNIPFEQEALTEITYKGNVLRKQYQADFICYDRVILEIKALTVLLPEHESQVLNYLKASGLRLGLLINFGQKQLVYKRFVYS